MLMIANNSLVLIKISLSYGTYENKSLSTDKDELQIHCDGFGPHHLGEEQLHPNPKRGKEVELWLELRRADS